MTHEEKNIGGRAEHPGSEEQKISQMLGSLRRVEAPKDFDFHLKARIANAKPSDYQRSGLLPILKYAMPLALFLVVGAGAVGISSYNTWEAPTAVVEVPKETGETPPAVPDGAREVAAPVQVTSPAPAVNAETPSVRPERPLLASNPAPAARQPQRRIVPVSPAATPEGRSADMTGGIVRPKVICAPGVQCKPLEAREAFSRLGLEAVYEGGAWKVKSVKANETAGQLGVKPGDRLKSINSKAVTDRTEFESDLKVTTIQVQRGRETIDLTINN